LAQKFEAAVQQAHDGSPPAPTAADCAALSALFSAAPTITSAGVPFSESMFCLLWQKTGVSSHTTTFVTRQVESRVVPPGAQTLSWWVVDDGVVAATNCSFHIPNVAWARVALTANATAPPVLASLEFVTDTNAPCFGN
jgi:hypothetical protein